MQRGESKRAASNSPSGDQKREPKRLRLAPDLWSEEAHRKKDEVVSELLAGKSGKPKKLDVNDRFHMAGVLKLVGDLASEGSAFPQFRVPAMFDCVEAIGEGPDLMELVGESYLRGSYKDLRRLEIFRVPATSTSQHHVTPTYDQKKGITISSVDDSGGVPPRTKTPPTLTLADVIQKAKDVLEGDSYSLKTAAHQDPKLDDSNPFFVDGLGALCDLDPDTRTRVSDLFSGSPKVVFNTSGSGKTRLMVEGLCQSWGLYLTPDLNPRLGSIDFSRALDNLSSYTTGGGVTFVPNIPKSPNSRREPLENNRHIARAVLRGVLISRLLVLQAFLKAGTGVPQNDLRRRWTYLQLMPSVLHRQFDSQHIDLFSIILEKIDLYRGPDELHHTIERLIDELQENASMPPSSSFFVVLDEAQLCADMYTGAFYSEKEDGPEESRSVLQEIFTSWDHFAPRLTVICSGTGFSLTKITRSPASSVGIIHDSGTFTDTGAFVREEQQRAYIMRHITLDKETMDEVLRRAWRWLRGRHRFTCGYVYLLRRFGTENASALLTQYVELLTGYRPTDGSRVLKPAEAIQFPTFRRLSEYFDKLLADELLCYRVAFAINTFSLRHKPHIFTSNDAQAIELGIARFTTPSEESQAHANFNLVIDEPLIIAGALLLFDESPLSLEEILRNAICKTPIRSIHGYDLEGIEMYLLAQELNGQKHLREIFDFMTPSPDIGYGQVQLIAIEGINGDGSFRYRVIEDPFRNLFGLGFEASTPSEHESWYRGTGIPFCFPDPRSGHDVGFFVLIGDSVVFVTIQFKSYSRDLGPAVTKKALKTLAPENCYKDKNGEIYSDAKMARPAIMAILQKSKVPFLGVLTSFPSKPHSATISEEALDNFALFNVSRMASNLGWLVAGFEAEQYPNLEDVDDSE